MVGQVGIKRRCWWPPEGVAPYYTVKRGWFVTASDGTNTWRDDPNGRHAYLVESMDPQRVAHEIESLMLYQPREQKAMILGRGEKTRTDAVT